MLSPWAITLKESKTISFQIAWFYLSKHTPLNQIQLKFQDSLEEIELGFNLSKVSSKISSPI
jgi:hypothetical protein